MDKKIKEAELDSTYRGIKLDELSKAFYSLKISHDQLEKNYVIKPMSIRNSIEQITNKNMQIEENTSIDEKNKKFYNNFLLLLEKSFNVQSGFILYKMEKSSHRVLSQNNATISCGGTNKQYEFEEIFNDYLVDKALARMRPIYVSDDKGEPNTTAKDSKFIAVIPSIQNDIIVSLLVIQKMPFMAFNRENLTSISILLEYFALEILEKNILSESDEIKIVKDQKFRYEYTRLRHLYTKFKLASILLVLRVNNELQAVRIYERVLKMLRSLDMVTLVENDNLYYITLMFPLHDKSAALGYLDRLVETLEEEKDKKFHYMTFDMSQNSLFNKYLTEDYNE